MGHARSFPDAPRIRPRKFKSRKPRVSQRRDSTAVRRSRAEIEMILPVNQKARYGPRVGRAARNRAGAAHAATRTRRRRPSAAAAMQQRRMAPRTNQRRQSRGSPRRALLDGEETGRPGRLEDASFRSQTLEIPRNREKTVSKNFQRENSKRLSPSLGPGRRQGMAGRLPRSADRRSGDAGGPIRWSARQNPLGFGWPKAIGNS
jgi:hypothetical protein